MSADPIWFRGLLAVHVVSGFGAFVLAPVALATAKGGRQHRRWGTVYLVCMAGIAATAFPMALYRPTLFLALVAVFSFYMAFAGFRVTKLKDLARGGRAGALDWAASGVTFGASACLAAFGAWRPQWVQNAGIVAIIFGGIGMAYALNSVRLFVLKPTDKMFWWYGHIQAFMGSYIATWSAFSVVVIAPQLRSSNALVWLWPTLVGTPATVIMVIYYRRKFGRRPATPDRTPELAAA